MESVEDIKVIKEKIMKTELVTCNFIQYVYITNHLILLQPSSETIQEQ